MRGSGVSLTLIDGPISKDNVEVYVNRLEDGSIYSTGVNIYLIK
jgi:hypothetical protein